MKPDDIKAIVDAIGWSGLRAQYPRVWAEIVRQRAEDDRYIDAYERGAQ